MCDVDLRSDSNHCGECNAACPADYASNRFSCIAGKCVLECEDTVADCDGIVENGCETDLRSPDNCGGCGVRCPEDAPCVISGNAAQCGCPPPFVYCAEAATCVRLDNDLEHCGACGNLCPDMPPDAVPPPHSHYGCSKGECGKLVCDEYWGDCNGDLNAADSDGCETPLGSDQNCVACGNNCLANGQVCGIDYRMGVFNPMCQCSPGETFCAIDGFVLPVGQSLVPLGICADLNSDPDACGACGRVCPQSNVRWSRGVCNYGICELDCGDRWADCNGNFDDACEVDIFSDPENCGGCGIACAPGQACAGGRCVVEPCSGEVAR